MLKRFSASLFLIALLAAPAHALTQAQVEQCNAMAATFPAKQASIAEQTAARDALAERTELAGETWEAAEELRAFSAEHAATADEARQTWESLKADTMAVERALMADVRMLNNDVAQFNKRCAPE